MVSMLASKAVHCRLEPVSDQAKDYKIGNCCFSVKQVSIKKQVQRLVAGSESGYCVWEE
jgi:hypothetical protein